MKEQGRNYLAVGTFVVVVGIGLVVWLAVLAGKTGASDPYYVVYDSVMGIGDGSEVLYQGYGIGTVASIEPLLNEGRRRFRVNLAIERGWKIPEDSEAVITAPGFLSAAVIDVRGGSSPRSLKRKSEIAAGASVDLAGAVSNAAGRVTEMLDRQVAPMLGGLADSTPEVLDNLRSFSAQLNRVGAQLEAVVSPKNLERIDAILASLQTASADASRLGSDLGNTRELLDRLLGRANGLLAEETGELDHAIRDLHVSLESIAVRSDAIAGDLEITARNLAEFSRQIRMDPSLLLRGGNAAEAP